jgi:hypothetical protein
MEDRRKSKDGNMDKNKTKNQNSKQQLLSIEKEKFKNKNMKTLRIVRTVTISERAIFSLLDEFIATEMAVLQEGKRGNKHSHQGIDQLFERDKILENNNDNNNDNNHDSNDNNNNSDNPLLNNIWEQSSNHHDHEDDETNAFKRDALPLVKVGEWERVKLAHCKDKGIGKCKWWEKKDKMLLNRIKELELLICDLNDSVGGERMTNKIDKNDNIDKVGGYGKKGRNGRGENVNNNGLHYYNEIIYDRENESDISSSMGNERGSDEGERKREREKYRERESEDGIETRGEKENVYMNDKELLLRARRGKYRNDNITNITEENITEKDIELISIEKNHQIFNPVNIRVRKETKKILTETRVFFDENKECNKRMMERYRRKKYAENLIEKKELNEGGGKGRGGSGSGSGGKKEYLSIGQGFHFDDLGIVEEKGGSEKSAERARRERKRNSILFDDNIDDNYNDYNNYHYDRKGQHNNHMNNNININDINSNNDIANNGNNNNNGHINDDNNDDNDDDNDDDSHEDILYYTVGIRTVPALLHIVSGGLGYHPIYQAQFPMKKDILVAVKLFSGPVNMNR